MSDSKKTQKKLDRLYGANTRKGRSLVVRDVTDAICRKKLDAFVHKAFELIEPGEFVWAKYIDATTLALMRFIESSDGEAIFNLPPRHTKSIIFSVAFVAWMLGHNPTLRFICISYSEDLAAKFSRMTRTLMEAPQYRGMFPNTRLARATEMELETTEGGGRIAASVGGTLTGKGGDYLILDDYIKPDEAQSDTVRNRHNSWCQSVAFSRVNSKHAKVIIAMQRVHQKDLCGVLIDQGATRVFSLPAIATEDETWEIAPDKFHTRKKGEALHPEYQDVDFFEKMKTKVGEVIFETQYQQNPKPAQGLIFKPDDFDYYDVPPSPSRDRRVILTFDTAIIEGDASNYTAIGLVYVSDFIVYLEDMIRRKVDFPNLLDLAKKLILQHDPTDLVIEGKGSGLQLISSLQAWVRRERLWMGNIYTYNPKEDKRTRAGALRERMLSGLVRIRSDGEFVGPLREELLSVPNGEYDDQVDALGQVTFYAEDMMPLQPRRVRYETPRRLRLDDYRGKVRSEVRDKYGNKLAWIIRRPKKHWG